MCSTPPDSDCTQGRGPWALPVAHSKSPLLHLAAYHALGLSGWTYDRIECGADELPGLVRGLGAEWVGLSVTMPGKFAALQCADERTERAELVGSANTLVRTRRGGAPTTPMSTVLPVLWGTYGTSAVQSCWGRAGRRRRRWWGLPNSAFWRPPSSPGARRRRSSLSR